MTSGMPNCALSARFVEDPGTDGDDEPARLERRDKLVRQNDAAIWVPPPQQRLDTRKGICLKIDRWLVNEEELVRAERVVQVNRHVTAVLAAACMEGAKTALQRFPAAFAR